MQRPALVAEVSLELTQDRRRGVARELRAAAGLEAVDCLDEAEARDLKQVVERLVGVRVAQRQVTRERQEALGELLPGDQVTFVVIANQEPALDLSRFLARAGASVPATGRTRGSDRQYGHLLEPPSLSDDKGPLRNRLSTARRPSESGCGDPSSCC